MNRSRVLFLVLSAALVMPILAGTLLRAAEEKAPEEDSFYKYLSVFSEVLGLVRQAYVDEPDTRALMSGALDGTTDALDPFSLYVPGDQLANYQQAQSVGRHYSGLALLKERGVAYVVAVEKGSPAAQANVRVGDIVAKIDNRSTRLMPLWEMQEILARRPGTHVPLELIRVGETVQAAFDLKPFEPPPVSTEAVQGATLLRIPSFAAGTPDEVRKALSKVGPQAGGKLLVDLRGVASGEPGVAYEVAQLFTTGDLGILSGRSGVIQSFAGKEPPLYQGKLVLLVDRGTLGASEVFAAILRQKIKAELVGERTFGHAGRQGVADLSSGGRLLFTDAFYTGPDKKPLKEALKPDLLVDERSRTYLEKDVPIGDLILKRGVRRLLGEDADSAKKAA
ncbi:MAG TPA: S41 family peptidase [Thermoanaerobaculia bacterium]|jgi:carboxyl-terminal processing protease|nr:S41 family peptidase [Thermoanaerobaculia bacterium]